MGMNDENEIIKISCDKCSKFCEGTYKELFGDLPSLVGLPKMKCKCGGNVCLKMTGRYKGDVEEVVEDFVRGCRPANEM